MWRLRNLECWLLGSQLIALQRHLNLLVSVTGVPALLLDTSDRTKWSCLVQTELTATAKGAPCRTSVLLAERFFWSGLGWKGP